MIDWTTVKALSFDCYGTLIDWEKGILRALGDWSQRFGERAVLAGFSAVEPDIEHAHPNWPYRRIVAEVYRQMAHEFGVEIDDDAAFGFAVSVGTWPAYPDTIEALQLLRRRFRLFILSNVDEISISGTLGLLEDSFEGVFTAEAIGSYKPDLANFDYLLDAVARRGIAPSELVHVAQSLFHDHAPAKAKGITTVWVDRNAGRAGAARLPDPIPAYDLRVATLGDLVAHMSATGVSFEN
jgi:2-haloacid dehalogenase